MVQLVTEAGLVELNKEEQPYVVTRVKNRFFFIAELVNDEVLICIYDAVEAREFAYCVLSPSEAVKQWSFWFHLLSSD